MFDTSLVLSLRGTTVWPAVARRFPRISGLVLSSLIPGSTLDVFVHLTDLDLQDANVPTLPLRSLSSLRRLQLPKRVSHLPVDVDGLQLPYLRELWLNAATECFAASSSLLSLSLTGLNVTLYAGAATSLYCLSLLSNLRWLNLARTQQATAGDLAHITRTLTKLQCLDVSGCPQLKKLTWVSPLLEMHTLNLKSLKLTDADLRVLKNLKRLRRLVLHFCDAITDAGLVQLIGSVELDDLDVRATSVTSRLRQKLPRCAIALSGKP